jgi:hypothetical protein
LACDVGVLRPGSDARHVALHAGLAREPQDHARKPLQHALAELRLLGKQLAGDHVGGTRLVVRSRHLAEELAGADVAEGHPGGRPANTS